MAISIQSVIEGQPELVTTELSACLQDVMAVMLEREFSQLPIVENEKPVGMVTSDSIGQALLHMKTRLVDLTVLDAKVAFKAVAGEDELFSVLDDILRNTAVLVVDNDGRLQGILTAYDTTQYLRRRSEDIILVEDIETTLRDYLRYACAATNDENSGLMQQMVTKVGPKNADKKNLLREKLGELRTSEPPLLTEGQVDALVESVFPANTNARPVTFDGLTLQQYIAMAGQNEVWPRLESIFGVKKDTFKRLLEPVRETRNELSHFRGDIPPLDRNRLRYCADWFKSHPVPTHPDTTPIDTIILEDLMPTMVEGPVTAIVDGQEVNLDGDDNDNDSFEGKYARLARYLSGQKPEVTQLVLGFKDIEAKIGTALPETAREHRSWWANDSVGHVQSRQWLAANWRVTSVDMREGKVSFQRMEQQDQTSIQVLSQVRAALESKNHFVLRAHDGSGSFETGLVRYELGSRGWVELSMNLTPGRSPRLKWFVNARDESLNDNLRFQLAAQIMTLDDNLKRKIKIERLGNVPSLPEGKGRLGAFRVIAEFSEVSPSVQDAPIDKIVDFAIKFHDVLFPLLQNLHPLSEQRLEQQPEPVGGTL